MINNSQRDCTTKATFSSLLDDQILVENLAKLNIQEPTDVQAASIPLALSGRDIIVQAQTGSGKTLAFMLPIISKIRTENCQRGTVALIIAPTRELALQVKTVVESIADDITPACLIGGASIKEQEQQLRNDSRIIVGTPGRILDFIEQRVVVLRKCSTFVLDEADEMLSMGFVEDVQKILSKLPPKRQGMFFSATMTPRVSALANSFLRNPEVVTVKTTVDTKANIEHCYCNVDGGNIAKAQALCTLLSAASESSAIVFCNTKSDTELVEVFLRRRNFNAKKINSDLSQKERDSVLTSLRNGELKYLIATDVAARGIDIKELELVINYSIPKDPENYVHRTGRTGRAGASGKAISLVAPQDFIVFNDLKRSREDKMIEIFLPETEPVTTQDPQAA